MKFCVIDLWKLPGFNKLRRLPISKKHLLIIFASITMLVILVIVSRYHGAGMVSLQTKQYETIMHELSEISMVVQQAANDPKSNQLQRTALQAIVVNVGELQKSLTNLAKASDIQGISKQITSVKEDIDSQLEGIKKSVSQNANGKSYLDPSILPFHVISVDVIAGQPYVSINYANHISPLGMNDMIAGWWLVNADYSAGSAEFINDKSQYIKVSLQDA